MKKFNLMCECGHKEQSHYYRRGGWRGACMMGDCSCSKYNKGGSFNLSEKLTEVEFGLCKGQKVYIHINFVKEAVRLLLEYKDGELDANIINKIFGEKLTK